MANSTRLEIVTPERLFYDDQVELVIVKTLSGEEGFMANHTWACKLLDVGELYIQEAGKKDFRVAAIAGGFIDVKDQITIFTDTALWPEEIDLERSKRRQALAEQWLEDHERDDEDINIDKIVRARKSVSKQKTRQRVAEGGFRAKKAQN